MTVLGIVSGIALAFVLRRLTQVIFPTLPILLTAEWMVRGGLIALAASLLGATYPAFRASKLDAIQAIAYE
jgi:putative ABC transport system permease protein